MRPRPLLLPVRAPMFGLVRRTDMGLIQNLRKSLRQPSRREVELDYLNQSTSRSDLEMREREIDRGRFRHLPNRG